MAKALYGYMARPDVRASNEIEWLRARVRELQTRVDELELERTLALSAVDEDLLTPVVG